MSSISLVRFFEGATIDIFRLGTGGGAIGVELDDDVGSLALILIDGLLSETESAGDRTGAGGGGATTDNLALGTSPAATAELKVASVLFHTIRRSATPPGMIKTSRNLTDHC